MTENQLSQEVTSFLDSLNHPMRKEIEHLREMIMNTPYPFSESIKWNGPNYSIEGQDRITMRINPQDKIQLIFHRGAKKMEQPDGRLIEEDTDLLTWKANDRAIASFKDATEIKENEKTLLKIIKKWVEISITN